MRHRGKGCWVLLLLWMGLCWPGLAALAAKGPPPLRLVGASSIAPDSLTAEWLPFSGSPPAANTVYTLHVSEAPGFAPSGLTAKWVQADAYGGEVFGLKPATRYYLKVVASDGRGGQSVSNELDVTTAAVAPKSRAAVRVQGARHAPSATPSEVRYADSAAPPQAGEYLASAEGRGYLRKVLGARRQNGRVAAATEPAALNEIFEDLELHSTFLLGPLPETAPAKLRNARTRAAGQTVAWPETGLRLSDAEGAFPAAPGKGQRVSVDGSRQTNQGNYTEFSGPAYRAAVPGDLMEFQLSATLFKDAARLKICSISKKSFTHKDSTKQALINADQALGKGLQVGPMKYTGPATNADKSANLRVSWQVDGKYVDQGGSPYLATFEVRVDSRSDGCFKSEETLQLEVPIYVTTGDPAGKGVKSLKFTGGFTVTDHISFDAQPKVEVGATISGLRLQDATLAVNANLDFQQTLTIQANGSARLARQTLPLLAPRRFVKVFFAGGVPVVVSGVFKIDAQVEGNAKGKLNLTETLHYAFPDARFGLEYRDGAWREISDFKPSYSFKLGGSGEAGADLTLILVPDLQVSFYDAATGRILAKPYLYANAGIHGQFAAQTGSGGDLSDLDYWFTNLETGGGLNLRLYAGLHVFDYNLASYPPGVGVNQVDQFALVEVIKKTPIAGIPRLSATRLPDAQPPKEMDSRAVLVAGSYQNVPNPFKALFGVGPAAYLPFKTWTEPKVITTQTGARLTPDADIKGRYWLGYTGPGTYEVRLAGYSSLGPSVRQVATPKGATDPDAAFVMELTDQDADGMVDQWEALWGVDDPAGDPDADGLSNLMEFKAGTRPNDPDEHFVKIANDGSRLPADAPLGSGAKDWACTQDNSTGLVWEVKTSDGGFRDGRWIYWSYDPVYAADDVYYERGYWIYPSADGIWGGWPDPDARPYGQPGKDQLLCGDTLARCTTHAYTEAVNQQDLCGAADWRMPTKDELFRIGGILNKQAYFSDSSSYQWTWSSSPFPEYSFYACWGVFFNNSNSFGADRDTGLAARLVHGDQ